MSFYLMGTMIRGDLVSLIRVVIYEKRKKKKSTSLIKIPQGKKITGPGSVKKLSYIW